MADRVRVRGLSIFRPIIYGNTATLLTPEERAALDPSRHEHTHRWTVAVRSAASATDSDSIGGADDLSYFIKRVNFKLHDTYNNPSRVVDKPPFEVTETGWGEFDILIRITYIADSGEKAASVYHHLKLHPWAGPGEPEIPSMDVAIKAGPVHSWQYDEIVFNEPFNSFLNTLTSHPPTPLQKTKRKPVPFHIAYPQSLEDTKLTETPEFSQEMEKEEADRLEQAKKKIVAEQERLRNILIEKEKELQELQKLVGDP